MPFVIDASIVLDWAFAEGHPTAGAVRERLNADIAHAPSLWWFEVRNGLVMAERRGRAAADYAASFLGELVRLPVAIDQSPDEAAVMSLARRHRLTVYDAAYLELALRTASPLATLDRALAEAARAEQAPLLGDPPP